MTIEGGIGCRKSTWTDSDINQIIPFYHKLSRLHENALTLPQTPVWPKVAELIDQMVLKSLYSSISSAELIKITQIEIQKLD